VDIVVVVARHDNIPQWDLDYLVVITVIIVFITVFITTGS